ncbi:hypothetical protein [Paraliomyxa miuraensis]|uniref:hypothetical protein n=1 Tax=Paraliomyxa miuraensis TaxID=376150 RepID=UPI002258A78A|nr:hypothetical protein [Paraliomyxa miuraensis]MCX4241054.1 hypothetical protein [Paraliomyxa miuraensis]
MHSRRLGHVFLWVGVIGGSFVAVRDPSAVHWPAYGAMAALALGGVVLLRKTAAQASGTADQVAQRVERLRDALVRADEELRALHEELVAQGEGADPYAVHERLDARLAEPLAVFADEREAMIPSFGLAVYGEVMTRFAAAERLVNRTWSASADGYIDEVRTCVAQAHALMAEARERFLVLAPRDER